LWSLYNILYLKAKKGHGRNHTPLWHLIVRKPALLPESVLAVGFCRVAGEGDAPGGQAHREHVTPKHHLCKVAEAWAADHGLEFRPGAAGEEHVLTYHERCKCSISADDVDLFHGVIARLYCLT